MEDSPPDFITFRTPGDDAVAVVDSYQLALELVEHVHVVLDAAVARVHLKDRLDRLATQITMRLGRARAEIWPNRWRHYRDIIEHLTDVGTMLDIVERQRASPQVDDLARAKALVAQLVAELTPLAALG